ncbi:hypothetical protein F4820DRAFT_454008 [Hypoxylon rubiginosum]|uniref:Uncharacterized protein n=1 Tax=Hypoxylon rubiginosum TaxID=110542 RepID=A0ACB9YK38_9PEZI|nr:hypothetical protein F4820DRAFT_454008 [Hypoxylon rubiginosum]
MAPREEGGVVDESLGVYGVEGLKIAGMSIPPLNVAANTNNAAIRLTIPGGPAMRNPWAATAAGAGTGYIKDMAGRLRKEGFEDIP